MIAMFSIPLFSKSLLPFVVDSPMLMTLPLIILSVGAVMLGFLSHELFLSYGSTFYMNSIFTHPHSNTFLFDASFGASTLAIIPVLFLTIILLIIYISPLNNGHTRLIGDASFNLELSPKGPNILCLVTEAWAEIDKDPQDNNESHNLSAKYAQLVTPFYTYASYESSISSTDTPAQLSSSLGTTPNLTTHFTLLNYFNVFYHWIKFFGLKTSNKIYRKLDKGYLEYFGPTGYLQYIYYIGDRITSFSTGFITHYAYVLIIYLLLSIFILIFKV
jgi:NADH:ubiquinone oxidoreductase subunit 5 (subunit L)/multisubunit Na+/H+ antiporter MnhA subunit